MPIETRQLEVYNKDVGTERYTGLTTGTIVDTNDPTNQGRLRIMVPRYGDKLNMPLDDIPWAIYSSPTMGTRAIGTRGPGAQVSEGEVAYGFFSPPIVGATALVDCIDGDTNLRVFKGCIPRMFTTHTMPHGRWIHEPHPALPDKLGPLTSREQPIQPLFDNIQEAFGEGTSIEKVTRAADYSIGRVTVDQLSMTVSSVADDFNYESDNWTQTNGYGISRIDPFAPTTMTDKNYDNQIAAWTTPGFHSISMDDRQENCRVRIRTTAGKQILLDDTNERIYIATAKGACYIEIDEAGIIDQFVVGDWNLHSGTVNVYADDDINLHAGGDINMSAGGAIRMRANAGMHVSSGSVLNISTDAEIGISSGAGLNIRSGDVLNITSGSNLNLLASGGSIYGTGETINLNGGQSAEAASESQAEQATLPTRIPQHEPWPRTYTKGGDTTEPAFPAGSKLVNKMLGSREITRGAFWRP